MQPPIGQLTDRASIISITNSLPCEVTTDGPHFFPNKSFVRLTDLNGSMPVPRGEDPLNNYKFRIIVTDVDKFTLQDYITFLPIDSTNFPPYVTGGSCNLVQPTFIYYPSPDQTYPN
jgi:hypothetical protein